MVTGVTLLALRRLVREWSDLLGHRVLLPNTPGEFPERSAYLGCLGEIVGVEYRVRGNRLDMRETLVFQVKLLDGRGKGDTPYVHGFAALTFYDLPTEIAGPTSS